MVAHPTSHPTDKTLSSYGLGKLDDASAEAVNQHLESCPDCRRRVAELSSDSFLGRIRDAKAQGRPDSAAPLDLLDRRPVDAGRRGSKLAGAAPGQQPAAGPRRSPRLQRSSASSGQGGMGVVYLAREQAHGPQGSAQGRRRPPHQAPRRAGALPGRDPQCGPTAPPQRGHCLCGRSARREPRPGHGVRRGPRPGTTGQGARPAAGSPRLQLRAPGGPGSPARSRKRHGPSRHQARQPHARRARAAARWSRCSTSG